MTDGVPVDACTLPTEEQPLRVQEFDELFRDHLAGVESAPGCALLTLRGRDDLAALVRDLADRESACCSFFRFEVSTHDDAVVLLVEVPPAYQQLLDALVARATG